MLLFRRLPKTIWVPQIEPAAVHHVQQMLRIERASFHSPWCVVDFDRVLQHPTFTGRVVKLEGTVVAYSLCYRARRWPAGTPNRQCLDLLNLAVAPERRGVGLGRLLLNTLKDTIGDGRIRTLVAERSLGAQLFFRATGFRANGIRRGYCDDGQDAYRFEWQERP